VKLAIYNNYHPGLVDTQDGTITPVQPVSGAAETGALGAGWWVRLCRDLAFKGRDALQVTGERRSLASVTLRAPVLNPGKIIACASNYTAHVREMREVVLPRHGITNPALLEFDIFLKAPSSIIGPMDCIKLPAAISNTGNEVHHESELAIVIGRGGDHIAESDAEQHILGYLIALDLTLRGTGDRSRRKSYPTFTPLGPWLTTADEICNWQELEIDLDVDGAPRQHARCGEMIVDLPGIVAYASRVMTLTPGDVILTGAPPGVGPIAAGEYVTASISHLGSMTLPVAAS
jgi:2-keto-4-pentenoate hydratase/2-oxohepta-3-ene-1,7-dioic acid hydratase in catechol pathway